jgi:hypothetical protein
VQAQENLNDVSIEYWWLHSLPVLIAIVATWHGRNDVLIALMFGPAMPFVIAVLGQQWAHPNWFQSVAVNVICWLVSTVVGVLYWGLKRGQVRTNPSPQQVGPAPSSQGIGSGTNGAQ